MTGASKKGRGICQTEEITNMKVVVICKTTPQCSGMHVRPEHCYDAKHISC